MELSYTYEVIVVKEGYSVKERPGIMRACGSVTLIKGPHNIIFDTGLPADRDLLLRALKDHGLSPESIEYCVCSHGHSDHVGNLNLFPKSTLIVSHDISSQDRYILHDFKEGIPYEIDDDVEVIATPGHTPECVSLIVRNSQLGTVVLSGDLFECEEDLEDPDIWQECSWDRETHQQSRIEVLRIADYIVPGHGKLFRVPDCYKGQMKMVMTP